MPTNLKKFAPAAERNQQPIAAVLRGILPESGRVLELASGTGQHAAYFAGLFPSLHWQPTDADPESLQSIDAWRRGAGVDNLAPALRLNVLEPWPVEKADAILCINLVHISPWEATVALLARAGRVLPPGGPLIFYGPYTVEGMPTAPSNVEFDAFLRGRDPAWGVRSFEVLRAKAQEAGFYFQGRHAMPANNFLLVFRKLPADWGIRVLEKGDEEALGDLLVSAFRDTYALKMPEVVMSERRERELRDVAAKAEVGSTLVAEVEGKVVGTVYVVRPGAKGTLAWRPDFAELKHLAVRPEYRRSGLSEALMKQAYSLVRSWGAEGVCLHVRDGAKGVAGFYEKQGFAREPGGDFDRLPEVFLLAYSKKW